MLQQHCRLLGNSRRAMSNKATKIWTEYDQFRLIKDAFTSEWTQSCKLLTRKHFRNTFCLKLERKFTTKAGWKLFSLKGYCLKLKCH
jgi:hypothetical protein